MFSYVFVRVLIPSGGACNLKCEDGFEVFKQGLAFLIVGSKGFQKSKQFWVRKRLGVK